MVDSSDDMRKSWNERANTDAYHFIETEFNTSDINAFFKDGERRAEKVIDPILEQWSGYEDDNLKALDIGCGVGRMTKALADRFGTVVGVDVSNRMIEMAQDLHKDDERLEFYSTDGESLPLKDSSVDFVFSYEVFQHLPSKRVIKSNLSEIERCLVTGGLSHNYVNIPRGWAIAFDVLPVPRAIKSVLPEKVLKYYHQFQVDNSLKKDATWRGVDLTKREWKAIHQKVGLEVILTPEDPTHETPVSCFMTAKK